MRFIISPAKRMRTDVDGLDPALLTRPRFQRQALELARWIQGLDEARLRELWNCNDEILLQNLERAETLPADIEAAATPAVLSYDGIQYQSMAPQIFETRELDYVQEHLCILSGLYGLLRPFDAVAPYRLEMGSKLKPAASDAARDTAGAFPGGAKDLYAYWGRQIAGAVFERPDSSGEDGHACVVDLASKEYSRCVTRHLAPGQRVVECQFYEEAADGSLAMKATYAKMARGEMVHYAAQAGAHSPEELRGFDRMGYRLREDKSDERLYVFARPGGKARK